MLVVRHYPPATSGSWRRTEDSNWRFSDERRSSGVTSGGGSCDILLLWLWLLRGRRRGGGRPSWGEVRRRRELTTTRRDFKGAKKGRSVVCELYKGCRCEERKSKPESGGGQAGVLGLYDSSSCQTRVVHSTRLQLSGCPAWFRSVAQHRRPTLTTRQTLSARSLPQHPT